MIASDDPRVHAMALQRFGIRTAVFIDMSISVFAVSDEVRGTLSRVNRWLHSLGSECGVPLSLLYWESHAEGGNTTQRIQDCVLLIRSYLSIIESFLPEEVVIISGHSTVWHDQLFASCAASRGASVRYINAVGMNRWVTACWVRWRPLAKELVLSSRIIRAWVSSRLRKVAIQTDKIVMIQLCSSAPKHLSTTEPLLRELAVVGLQGVVVGWGAARGVTELISRGFTAVELEDWVSLKDLVRSWWGAANAWRNARLHATRFLDGNDGFEYEQLLRSILWDSMRGFFLEQIPDRLRHDAACRKFFTQYSPLAARLWTRVLPQAVTAYHALPETNRPLLFWQPGWPYNIAEPLRDYPVPSDLTFVLSGAHKSQLIREGVHTDQIIVAGLPWLEEVRQFGIKHSRDESRAVIGIPRDIDACILFDSSFPLPGWMSVREQIIQVRTLLNLARRLHGLHLIIKPHQGHRPGYLEEIVAEYSLANVHFLTRDYPIFHALNAADLLITKMSTLAIQAMCLNIPTVAVLLDREPGFMCYEDAVDYAYTIEDLIATVERVVANAHSTAAWRISISERSVAYLERHELQIGHHPNTTIAVALLERLIRTSVHP